MEWDGLHSSKMMVRRILGQPFARIPQIFDLLAPAISAFEQESEKPRNPAGALHHPASDGNTQGDYPGYVMRTSAYTRAGLHPLTTTVLAAGATAAAMLLLGRPRS